MFTVAPKDPKDPFADYSVDRLDAFLAAYVLQRDIGSRYEYSNLGAGLLGLALARRAGVDYETLVTDLPEKKGAARIPTLVVPLCCFRMMQEGCRSGIRSRRTGSMRLHWTALTWST